VEINEAMSVCHNNGIKVYPIHVKGKWQVEVNNKTVISKGKKLYSAKKINEVIKKTYIYLAERVLIES
jgi:hypothetical protein